jgi:EpsI family protein
MKCWREFVLSMVILLTAAVGVRSLSHGEAPPMRKSFVDFPLHIAQWSGKELGLDAQTRQVLQVDDYTVRQYWRTQGMPIGLFVSYYKSMRQGKGYHSPKNCLPGSGWYFSHTGKLRLDVPDVDGQAVEVKKLVIQKGLDKQLVLYWYQDRGRILTSEYWAKIYLVWDAITKHRTDGAFVRIMMPFSTQDEQAVLAQAKAFAETIFPLLGAYLPS